ncbi:hypothetical protein BT96DRAFT_942810 [Gymnopus androsaceus JB14]|uniref:Uncharacterized protein n=1 Tax=Gymnopus androsaceus JB14 TaxID=1447944 RepID=A0A6A4H9Z0_9AGAR|nr:hypothetical protein BT96DRAFT_942810 [Gymnopus androsaceus JB14]
MAIGYEKNPSQKAPYTEVSVMQSVLEVQSRACHRPVNGHGRQKYGHNRNKIFRNGRIFDAMTYLGVLNLKMVIKNSFYTQEVIPEYFHTPLEDSNYKEQALFTIDPHVGSMQKFYKKTYSILIFSNTRETGRQITVPENPRRDGHGPNTTVPSTITDGYSGMP